MTRYIKSKIHGPQSAGRALRELRSMPYDQAEPSFVYQLASRIQAMACNDFVSDRELEDCNVVSQFLELFLPNV